MNPNKQRWCLWKKRIVGSKGSRLKNKSGWGGQEKEAFLSFFKRRLLLSFFLPSFLPSFLFFFLSFFLSFFRSFFRAFLSFYFFLSFFISFFLSLFSFFLSFPDFVFFDPWVLPSFRDSFLVFSHVFWILFFLIPICFFDPYLFFLILICFFWSLSHQTGPSTGWARSWEIFIKMMKQWHLMTSRSLVLLNFRKYPWGTHPLVI